MGSILITFQFDPVSFRHPCLYFFIFTQSELLLNLDDEQGFVDILSKGVDSVSSSTLCERYLAVMSQISGEIKLGLFLYVFLDVFLLAVEIESILL